MALSLLAIVINDADLDVLADILAWVVDINYLKAALNFISISSTTNIIGTWKPGLTIVATWRVDALVTEVTVFTIWSMWTGANFSVNFEFFSNIVAFELKRSQIKSLGLFISAI